MIERNNIESDSFFDKKSYTEKGSFFRHKMIGNYGKKTKVALIFIMVILLLLLFTYRTLGSAVYEQLNKFGLMPEPERFTELYFDDYDNLPKKIIDNKTISFSFTVHNLEGMDKEYPYVIYTKKNHGETVLDIKTVSVKNNEYKTVTESYTFNEFSTEEIVFIELIEQDQKIHFLLTNTNKE